MKPSQLSCLHSGVFRWLLLIITIFTVLLSLVSMLILATALRDHYAGDAELTTLGLQNVWTLVSFSIVTIIVSVLGGVGACFHNDILLKVYGAVTLASLVVHFLMQGLGMLHLLEFTPHMMSDSGQQITGPICYKDLLSELRQRMDQPQAVMEELDQPRGRDPVLLALLERYANETSLYREIMRGDHHTNTPRPVKDAPRPVAIAEVDSSVAAPIKPRGNGRGREKDSAWHNRSDNQRRTRVIAGRGGATLPSSLQVPGLGHLPQ
ncbi:uncharacterized protein LOC119111169 [Pollicipes pollicipes]|uniref:uncharacterized protein LOC119111169 n=1 Tax=Pollicipes pollicipes TaxID=41117 RepID=UPI0018855698|nr:uncharacterized protein LOC119111169 [Pollicipes pollicipes]